jgi:hypothetical protein
MNDIEEETTPDALVYINPNHEPMLTLGPNAWTLRVKGDVVTILHKWDGNRVTMGRRALCTGMNDTTNKPFRIEMRQAALDAAKLQGVPICKGPLLGRKHKW